MPAGQPPGPVDRPDPPLGGLAGRGRGDDQNLITHAQPGVGRRGERLLIADDEAHRGAARQPELAQVDPAQPGAHRHADLQQVRVQLVQRGGVDLDLPGLARHHAQPARHERQRRALQESQDDDEHEDGVNQPLRVRRPLLQRHERQHDRHRTAQPGPRQECLLAPRHPERRRRHDHRERPCGHHEDDPGDQRGDDGVDQPGRRGVEPEQHEQPDLGQPARALGERRARRRGAAGWSCRGPARRRRSRAARRRARACLPSRRAGSRRSRPAGTGPSTGAPRAAAPRHPPGPARTRRPHPPGARTPRGPASAT